jgi:alpha-amylase
MVAVCFYFQIHQPYRLRRYSVFDAEPDYFDEPENRKVLQKVAERCYVPTTRLMLDLVRQHEGRFRVAYSLTGTVIEQLQRDCPEVIHLLQELAATGCCEFLAETYYHSLSFLYSRDEFRDQIQMHTKLMQELFGQTPRVFRNTELIYSNDLAYYLAGWDRFEGLIVEGADHILGYRSPNYLYTPPGIKRPTLLLKNYRLSDDIAFRFSDRRWSQWPLTADRYASWVNGLNRDGHVCNLFMDYETFGEHQWANTGIFEFMRWLPGEILKRGDEFKTPSECIDTYPAVGEYDVPFMISWADTERDLSAWLGNAMQYSALHELFKIERSIKHTEDPALLKTWRLLTTSDHYYYMCTKYFADGDVHKYFNPYESPYDSYINFMNALDNLRTRAGAS